MQVCYKHEIPLRYLKDKPISITVHVEGAFKPNVSFALSSPQQSQMHTEVMPHQHQSTEATFISGTSKKKVQVNLNSAKQDKSMIRHEPKVTEEIQAVLNETNSLTTEQIQDSVIGFNYLGSGGGGDAAMLSDIFKKMVDQDKVKILPWKKLPDDAFVICFAFLGAPTVLKEKLPSIAAIHKLFDRIEKERGRKLDAIVSAEGAGFNGLLCEYAAIERGTPFFDLDCMGRAYASMTMFMQEMKDQVKEHVAYIENASCGVTIKARNASELETQAREAVVEMGGFAFLATMPMTGLQAKQTCNKDTSKIAELYGRTVRNAIRKGDDVLNALKKAFKDTQYEHVKSVFSGHVHDLKRDERGAFTVGFVVIKNKDNEFSTIIFVNENLVIHKGTLEKPGEIIVEVPDLISVVDPETFTPILCGGLRIGQEVRVLTSRCPEAYRTPEAKKAVGLQAYNLDNVISSVEQTGSSFFNFEKPNVDGKNKKDKEDENVNAGPVRQSISRSPRGTTPVS